MNKTLPPFFSPRIIGHLLPFVNSFHLETAVYLYNYFYHLSLPGVCSHVCQSVLYHITYLNIHLLNRCGQSRNNLCYELSSILM
jgi:hypothetical protein